MGFPCSVAPRARFPRFGELGKRKVVTGTAAEGRLLLNCFPQPCTGGETVQVFELFTVSSGGQIASFLRLRGGRVRVQWWTGRPSESTIEGVTACALQKKSFSSRTPTQKRLRTLAASAEKLLALFSGCCAFWVPKAVLTHQSASTHRPAPRLSVFEAHHKESAVCLYSFEIVLPPKKKTNRSTEKSEGVLPSKTRVHPQQRYQPSRANCCDCALNASKRFA
ncbi:hypothetical protein TGRUB_238030 [Toxoplasma gondii RUB]|uniref:Uncharacterized protein n=1 Tax=Toxoplasma gondii RUB TaxID=935652 RepID=A0A086LJW8_TOXGO|nr:hypothetical protein TGRUB_238030 [Toxoplasma gondii RUB]